MTNVATTPPVHVALAAVMRDVTPVGKDQINKSQKYSFRGIDDLMSAVAGPMRAHGVFVLPEVVEKSAERRGDHMTVVRLTMRFRIVGPAGDVMEATVPGEAFDVADKATNKAMSAAFKYFLLQVLMIPVDGRSIDDGDRDHPVPAEPVQRPQKPVRQAPAPKPAPPTPKPAQAPVQRPVQAALAPSHEAFYALVESARKAATEATDSESLRGIYRKADANGLLDVPVKTAGGEMPLKNFLIFRGSQLANTPKAQVAA